MKLSDYVISPLQKLILKLILLALVIAGIFFSGFFVRGYMADKAATEVQLAHQEALNQALQTHTDDLQDLIKKNQELQAKIDQLGTDHTKALNEKLAENATLRRDLAVARRMSLRGTSCPQAAAASGDPNSGSVGDGAPVELSESTRLAVWDLRESLLRDTAKVTYLQEFIRTACK
jgi:prophage endopeptidase